MTTPTRDPGVEPGFTTAPLAAVFGADERVRAMARFEVALAVGGAAAGVVPAAVADRIAALDTTVAAPGQLLAEGWEVGTPVLPLLAVLRGRLDDEAAGWLHHGATSQDVLDTATMLQLRTALHAVGADLDALVADLASLAAAHRDAPARTWTLLQEAVPGTWGLRFARWLAPVVAHARRGRQLAADLPLQLGGPVGALSDVAGDPAALVAAVADELGLAAPLVAWHTDRGPVERVVAHLLAVARTAAHTATSLALLAQQGELAVRAGGSSAMPGKRNPVDAVRAVAAAEACAGAAWTVLGGRAHELERAAGGWQAEWFAVPLVAQTAGAAVEAVARAVASIELTPAPVDAGAAVASGGAIVDRVLADARRADPARDPGRPGDVRSPSDHPAPDERAPT